jgi:hypothetical protein
VHDRPTAGSPGVAFTAQRHSVAPATYG